jgi:type III restriction enzyme
VALADGLVLDFAGFLDTVPGVVGFARTYLAVGFRLDSVRADGELASFQGLVETFRESQAST